MDYKKTGRLIAKRRNEMNMTLRQLSELLLVSPQAVSAWEKGNRYPNPSSQVMIEKVMGLNPVELSLRIQPFRRADGGQVPGREDCRDGGAEGLEAVLQAARDHRVLQGRDGAGACLGDQ